MNILTRRARTTSEKLGRDDSALDDWNRVLDIDYANLGGAPRDRRDPSASGGANELVAALHQLVDRARGAHRRRGAEGDLPRARQDLRRAAAAAVRRSRRVAKAPRGRVPTSRRWTRSRPSTAPRRSGRTSSTSRCGAPRRSASRPSRSRSCAAWRALWREQVGDPDGARGAVREDPRDRSDDRRGVHGAREAPHGRRPVGAARGALARAPRDARGDFGQDASSSARSPGSSRRSSTTRTRRSTPSSTRSPWTSTTARRRDTWSAWPRPRAAGPRSSRRSTAGSSSRPSLRTRFVSACTWRSGTATTSVTPSTRSRITRRSSSSIR